MKNLSRFCVRMLHACRPCALLAAASLLLLGGAARAATPSDTLVVRDGLGITLPWRALNVISTSPLNPWISGERTEMPKEGETVRMADTGEVKWQRVVTDSTGWFSEKSFGERFVAAAINRTAPGPMILEAMGHDIVYVNGTPRVGNQYQQKEFREAWEPHFDYSQIPVNLKKGENVLLFRYTRGRLKIKLYPPTTPTGFNSRDVTLPDAVVGSALDAPGGIVLINATGATLRKLSVICAVQGAQPDTTMVPQIPAMGVRKISFRIRLSPRQDKGEILVRLTLVGNRASGYKTLDTTTIPIRVVDKGQARRETFVSSIDGSVQFYGVTPQRPGFTGRPALFFSLHGAGVDALNQAASYYPKTWGMVIAPTNRRPYGFSWEDWGRLDALEVLERVKKEYNFDEGRVYLTGHSMGGHGTWFMGATYPDKFAAIGPSAGWITFQSYRFSGSREEKPSATQQMLRRAATGSDLFSLADNYRHFGVYIIHGEKDDNVPREQSLMMIDRLNKINHKDFIYHEQPGAGHWWDISPEPGADCVDWRPLFDFFARHVRPGVEQIRTIDFTTANPGVSARDNWLTIDAQERQLSLSTARLHVDPGLNLVQGTTDNIQRLAIERNIFDLQKTATVELDSQKVSIRADQVTGDRIWFEKQQGTWKQASAPTAAVKGEGRYGTFKESFRNRMALVFGTSGNTDENRWAFERARYDAEKLWYQGNGSLDVLADTEFVPSAEPDRNVILYGNSRTNHLWKTLLQDSPVNVDNGRVELGGKTVKGSDICCIFVRPRQGSDRASVGVISGSGLKGMALSSTVRYLEPGLGLPDLTIFNSEILTKGEAGIVTTGFFGLDWSMTTGEFVAGQ